MWTTIWQPDGTIRIERVVNELTTTPGGQRQRVHSIVVAEVMPAPQASDADVRAAARMLAAAPAMFAALKAAEPILRMYASVFTPNGTAQEAPAGPRAGELGRECTGAWEACVRALDAAAINGATAPGPTEQEEQQEEAPPTGYMGEVEKANASVTGMRAVYGPADWQPDVLNTDNTETP